MGERVAKRVVIHGWVQGVFFRDTMRRKARTHGVSGWARNRSDGTVEALLEGEREAVAALVAFAHEGPRGARVEHVEVAPAEPTGAEDFRIA